MPQQHMVALAHANRVRSVRHKTKQQITAGELTVAAVLADMPPGLERMPLAELLMAQHRWGTHKARRLCKSLMIGELRPIGTLTARERDRITGMIRYSSQGEIEWAA